MSEERWLTTGEAARAVGVDPSTLNRYVRAGLLRPTRSTLGGHHRWKLSDLEDQMAQIAGGGDELADPED